MSILKIFIPNSLCVFSHIKDEKHIEQNFHSVARVMPLGGTCGSKTLAWGFAMAPHPLRAIVSIAIWKNSVSNDFLSMFIDGITVMFLIAAYLV